MQFRYVMLLKAKSAKCEFDWISQDGSRQEHLVSFLIDSGKVLNNTCSCLYFEHLL